MTAYRCNHCGKTVERDSAKHWIKSYCEATGRTTRLWKVTTREEEGTAHDRG